MQRLHWLGTLTAIAMLFTAAANADDHGRRDWDRGHHQSDRWDRRDHGRGHDDRWRDRGHDWRGHDNRWNDRGHRWRDHDNRWDGRGNHWRGYDRWDGRRYHHRGPPQYWVPPGHRYYNGYRRGYWDGRYYGGDYYGYYPPRYRRSGIDGTLILSFPIY